MPRILILHASIGSGHLRAAMALSQAFSRKQDAEVRVEDALDYGSPLFRQAYTRAYIDLSERAPILWRLFYEGTLIDDPDWVEMTNRLRSLVERLGVTDLQQLIKRFAPAVIICTHFLPVELLLRLKNKGRLPQPIYLVITDFVAHTFWVTPGIDGYFVASDMTREHLIARGALASTIRVSGIPVDLAINEPKPVDVVRERHGLPLNGPVVTLFGGGLDITRVRRMIEGVLACNLPGMLIVVAGRNEQLADALGDLTSGPTMGLRVLSTIDYVDDLMAASDLAITKSGGLIVSEALARGTPLVLIDPIPGQEEWNADYVVSMGAGVQLRIADMTPLTVQRLLNDPGRLMGLRTCAREIGRPRAALDIAEQILQDLRRQW